MIRLIGIYLATGDWASMFREKYATDDSNVYARTLRPQAIITIVSTPHAPCRASIINSRFSVSTGWLQTAC